MHEAQALLRANPGAGSFLRRYQNGQQLLAGEQPAYIIDFFGLSSSEAELAFPEAYQILLSRVYPEESEPRPTVSREMVAFWTTTA